MVLKSHHLNYSIIPKQQVKRTMNHRLLFATLLALLGMALYTPLSAQQANGDNMISIRLSEIPTNDDDEPISMTLAVLGEGEITIDGVKEPYAADRTSYTPTGLEITIRGAVTSIRCDFCSVLSMVDITKSTTIQKLNLKNSSISELKATGSTTLRELVSARSSLKELDLTGCTALTKLDAGSSMKLKSVTLSGCTALQEVALQNGEITELDLTGLNELKTLELQRNPLTSLKLTGLGKLTMLDCAETKITALDLTDCVALEDLAASACSELTSVKMPTTGKLKNIYLQGAQLQEIDLTNLPELQGAYLERNKLSKLTLGDCPKLKILSIHLNALSSETTLALVQSLVDHGAEYDATKQAFKVFATGEKFDYEEANVWSPKAASVARRKGWDLLHKNENEYGVPTPVFSYAKVTIQESEHGRVALEGFDSEDLPYLPQGKSYKVVATPDEGYELTALTLNEDDILAEREFKLFEDSKIVATFAKPGDPNAYQYYLTKVESSVAHPNLKTYTYGYDDNKCWQSRTERAANGNLSMYQKIHHDDQGRISEIEFTTAFDKDGKPSMYTYYTYDDKGLLVRRQMTYVNPLADYKIVYRADGQKDYWADEKAGVMNLYLYNDKGQLVEEHFGMAGDLDKERPSITTPSGKVFYSYDDEGRVSLIRYAGSNSEWRYIKGEQYTWSDKGLLATVRALNYKYEQGEKDPEKGKPNPVFELRYQYDDKAETKVFWPKLPFTEDNGGFYEFSYLLEGYCHKAEYYELRPDGETHPLDFVYTFEASPVHLQQLVAHGETTVRYEQGTITAEGAALEGIQIYDTTGQLLRDYRTASCQRIDMGVRELPGGLYIVRTISTGSTQTDKVMVTQ